MADEPAAHVGLSEREALDRGLSVQTFTVPLAEVDRAVLDGETDDGFARLHGIAAHLRMPSMRIIRAALLGDADPSCMIPA